MAGFAPGLAPMTARPPTPPREKAAKASPSNGFGTSSASHVLLDTPDESPSSSSEYFRDSTGKAQKKVGFTLLGTQYHRFSVGGQESDSDGQIRQLPRSRDCKSSKSILKACTDNAGDPSGNELLAFDNTNFPAMLRSITQHLTSASRTSRLDTYSTLLACLSAYDEVPEAHELAEKVAGITGYIRRDITAKIEGDGSLDTQLAIQALKLTIVFLCTPSIAAMFPEDFCSFMLERSIMSLEDEALPKMLLTHYMQLLEKQKFASKHMTSDRVNRLISSLEFVTARVKGNRVVGHRLMIYQRLVSQAKPLMISRVESWFDHLVSGMLSTIKDIRSRAIVFGVDASLQLGTTSSVSQACLEVFNRASADGTKVVDFLSSRLIEMATLKEDGIHVPQIWSVMIMFLRGRRRLLEGWEHLRTWLVVIQRCFNSNDGQTKSQANYAWNRLIFAINLDTSTSSSMAKMLRQPIVSQLERKVSDKNSKLAKQIARSSYCTLLYYSLRPTATFVQLDQYWDLYVDQILPSCSTAGQNDINHACDILSALFSGNGKPKIWEENRANNRLINPEDLPCLDPKWIRLRTARIMHVFHKLFDIADWQLSKDGDAPIVIAWRSFSSALGNAGGKEVKVSMDAMNAIAQIVNEIKLLLERSNSKPARERIAHSSKADLLETFEKIGILISETAAKVGNIPFLEQRLIRTSQDSFEAAENPPGRSSRGSASLNSPIVHLLNLLLSNVQHVSTATSYVDSLKTVLNISLQSATSRQAQLGMLRNLGRLISLDGVHQKKASSTFWKLLAQSTSSALKLPQQNETHNDSPQYPGQEFREAVKILELGIQLRSDHNASTWFELCTQVIDTLRKNVGDEAIGLVIIEPLAGFVSKDSEMCDDFVLAAATSMLEAVHWPQSSHLIQRAQHRLWGATHVAPKLTSQDPFDKLYSMMGLLLSSSYTSLETLPLPTLVNFISATTRTIASCPPEFVSMVLFRIQQGLAPWIQDVKGLLSLGTSSPFRTLCLEVNKLWIKVMKSIEHTVVFDTRFLFSIQDLVVAGFRSRHKAVVNESIIMWNNTFGGEATLDYPKDLKTILQKLRPMTELRLPNFTESNGEEFMSSPLYFVDSQYEEEMQLEPVMSPNRPPLSAGPLQRIAESIKGVPRSPDSKRVAGSQGSPSSARPGVKTTPKARLRHDNSQIQFAAIESSPLRSEIVESQYLTDRQKEVKERQGREAAAMFPEIRSSPRSTSGPTDYMLPKLVFKSTQDLALPSGVGGDSSPTYLPDALMNAFLGSSPTPSSKRSSDRRYGDDPPSSPPFTSSNLQSYQLADAPLAHEEQIPVQTIADAGEDPGNLFANENQSSTKGCSANDLTVSGVVDAPGPVDDQEAARNMEAPQVPVSIHPMSDFDIYVDAPSAPSLKEPANEDNDNQPNDLVGSFQSDGSSHFSVEDEQVTAQLITEMEHASSQKSAKQAEAAQSAPGASKKRKRTADTTSVNKKTKHTPPASSDPQTAAEIPRTGETTADCVMIDVRKADLSLSVLPQQIKRELSASPSIFISTQAVEETPVAQKRPEDGLRNSEASQSSSQKRDAPGTTKRAVGRPRGSRNSQIKLEETEKDLASDLRKSTRVSERVSGSTTSSPHVSPAASQASTKGGPWLALGKTPRKGMFRWLQRSSAESKDVETRPDPAPTASSANEGSSEGISEEYRVQTSRSHDLSTADHHREHQTTMHNEERELVANQIDGEAQTETSSVVETEGDRPTAQGILQRFQSMLDNIKRVTFGPEEERAMVGILFKSVKEVHEAGRRHTSV